MRNETGGGQALIEFLFRLQSKYNLAVSASGKGELKMTGWEEGGFYVTTAKRF